MFGMMDLHVKLGLFLTICAAVSTIDVPEYIPQLAGPNVKYNVTFNTFVLDQPNCIFNQYPTTNVWLVVAKSDAVPTINEASLGDLFGYSSFKNNDKQYYHTLPMPAGQYACSNSSINVLLVGSETCTVNQFCNGPINNSSTYRVKFVLLASTGLFTQTKWSKEIVLPAEKSFQEETAPKDRSGGMIALTAILSVLLAILLFSLLVALAIGSDDICWKKTLLYEDMNDYVNVDYLTRGTYTSHYVHSSFRGRRPLTEDM